MYKTFTIKNSVNTVRSVFFVDFSREYGLYYRLLEGVEPSWIEVLDAVTYLAYKMDIPRSSINYCEEIFYLLPGDDKDIRYNPILIKDNEEYEKLPITIESDIILERNFTLSFSTVIYILLCLSMKFKKVCLRLDKVKIDSINTRIKKFYTFEVA